jgi:hypothetical protein
MSSKNKRPGQIFVSKCCKKEAIIVISDNTYFQCTKCGEHCDILPIEEVLELEGVS